MPEDLTEAEKHLIACVENGEEVNFTNYEEIRAQVIIALADSERDKEKHPVDAKGISLFGAEITGSLDFEGMTLDRSLWLSDCNITNDIILRDAQAQTIAFQNSNINTAIQGDRLKTGGGRAIG